MTARLPRPRCRTDARASGSATPSARASPGSALPADGVTGPPRALRQSPRSTGPRASA